MYYRKRGKPDWDGVWRLGYIESTGTQYIDTGIVPDINTRVVMDFYVIDEPTTNTTVFGCDGQFTLRWNNGTLRWRHATGTVVQDFSASIKSTGKHIADKHGNLCILDGEESSVDSSSTGTTKNIFLFSYNNKGTPQQYCKMRLYSCQIYSNGQLMRDYRPALDKAGAACLYDKVSKSYVYNAGSGAFVAG